MKKLLTTFIAASIFSILVVSYLSAPVQAQTKAMSSIHVENSIGSEGSANVRVEQSVSSSNDHTIVYVYREVNGKVIEDSRQVIGQNGTGIDIDRAELKRRIHREANTEVDRESEAALQEFKTELQELEQEAKTEFENMEEEIARERDETAAELEEIEESVGSVEDDLQRQWNEQLQEEEQSFWQRMRDWINERIAALRD